MTKKVRVLLNFGRFGKDFILTAMSLQATKLKITTTSSSACQDDDTKLIFLEVIFDTFGRNIIACYESISCN